MRSDHYAVFALQSDMGLPERAIRSERALNLPAAGALYGILRSNSLSGHNRMWYMNWADFILKDACGF